MGFIPRQMGRGLQFPSGFLYVIWKNLFLWRKRPVSLYVAHSLIMSEERDFSCYKICDCYVWVETCQKESRQVLQMDITLVGVGKGNCKSFPPSLLLL